MVHTSFDDVFMEVIWYGIRWDDYVW